MARILSVMLPLTSTCHVTHTDQHLSVILPHCDQPVCCVTTCICLLCYHTDQYLSVMLPHWPQQPVSVCHVITLSSISLSSALSSICLSCYQHDQYLSVLLPHWPAPDLESALLPHWPVSAVLLPQRAQQLDRKRVRLACKRPPSSIPTSGTFFRGDLVMKTFSTAILPLPLIQKRAVVSYWRKNVH